MVTARHRVSSIRIIGSEGQKSSVGASEMLCAEHSVDFSNLMTPLITPHLIALTMQTAGSGSYRVRIGGTPGVADGFIAALLSTTHAAYQAVPDRLAGPPFANPAGPSLVKLTITATAAQRAKIRAYEILFTT